MISPADMDAWVRDYEARDPARWIVEVDPDEAERIAVARVRKGGGKLSFTADVDPLQIDRIGAFGELASSRRLGLAMPEIVDGGSDGGIDFRARYTWPNAQGWREVTLDIKTREELPTRFLAVRVDKLHKPGAADWFVMVQKRGNRCHLLGWEFRSAMALYPQMSLRPGGVISYACPIHQLRPMFQLEYLLGLRQS